MKAYDLFLFVNKEFRSYWFETGTPSFLIALAKKQYFIRGYTNRAFQESKLYDLIDSLRDKDFETFFTILRSILANIDYDLHIPQEKYYQTVFYLVFTLIGLRVSAEVKTNIGRIDAVIEDNDIYLFEFKFNDTAKAGLDQIHKNKYFEKYFSKHKNATSKSCGLYLFGVEFKDKTVGEWIVEEI